MRYEILSEGFVSERQPNTPTAVAAGARCALTRAGDVVCTYMVQSSLGINDFQTTLSRSSDGGNTWQEQGPLWPHLRDRFAIFGSVSGSPGGNLYFWGSRTVIDEPGETFWLDATQGLKQNELIWAVSTDGGVTWSDPTVIPMPIPGAAEAPGPMCITQAGRWLFCYAPYNTFDPNLVVDRNQVVVAFSDDRGATWRHGSMLRFDTIHSTGAEAWVVELADGRLLGTSWHMNQADGSDFPNAYALSHDGGLTWTPTRSTGIMGQATALTPLADGRALFTYNQRKHGEVGVWTAVVNPTDSDFGIEHNEILWRAQTTTQSGSTGDHSEWQDYSFGEPATLVLPDGILVTTLWCVQPSGRGIRYVRWRLVE